MSHHSSDPEPQPLTGISLTPERRQYARYNVRVPLELRVSGSDVPIRLETTDLSRNGCYVENNMTLSVGTQIEGKLWLAGTRILVRGRIVTSHPQFGNGIMFLEFEGDGAERLRTFLESMPAS